jgi:hypothetical protein
MCGCKDNVKMCLAETGCGGKERLICSASLVCEGGTTHRHLTVVGTPQVSSRHTWQPLSGSFRSLDAQLLPSQRAATLLAALNLCAAFLVKRRHLSAEGGTAKFMAGYTDRRTDMRPEVSTAETLQNTLVTRLICFREAPISNPGRRLAIRTF